MAKKIKAEFTVPQFDALMDLLHEYEARIGSADNSEEQTKRVKLIYRALNNGPIQNWLGLPTKKSNT